MWTIYPVFVDRFGRSLRFCHLEFDMEAISDGFMVHIRVLGEGMIFSNYRELSFYGPSGPYFYYMFPLLVCLDVDVNE